MFIVNCLFLSSDTGGTLKIYGEALCKDVPYKTLLLSIQGWDLIDLWNLRLELGLKLRQGLKTR